MRGSRIVQVLGPLDLPSIADLRWAFVQLASTGPHARVGLLPHGPTAWEFAPDLIAERADELVRIAPDGADDGESILQAMRDAFVADLPVQVLVSGTHLAVRYDHELVDATVAAAFPRALIEAARAGRIADEGVVPPSSLPTALLHSFGLRPRAWGRLAKHVREHRRTAADAAVREVPAASHSGRVPLNDEDRATRHVQSMLDGASVRQLLRWGHAHDLGMGGTLLLLASAALEQAGVPTCDQGTLIVNLRRYLPRGSTTTANFVTGLPLATPRRSADVAAFARDLHGAIESGRPLMAAAASAVKRVLAPRDTPTIGATIPRPDQVRVSASYVGTLRDYERLPWAAEPGGRTVLSTVETAAAGDVGWTMLKMHGSLHAIATFRGDVVPAERVRAAAASMAADPIAVLTDAVGS